MTGNKGEWSELYAFLKLLATGKLYNGGEHLRVELDRYYPILKVFRSDAPDRVTYEIKEGKKILVAGHRHTITIPQDEFATQAANLLDFIKKEQKSNGSRENSTIVPFLRKIDVDAIKAKSSDKADIRLVIHDLRTGAKPEMGYSIKSRLGGSSTLINSNKNGTNFIYTISDFPLNRIREFNSLDRFKAKFDLLEDVGASVRYLGPANDNLKNNLLMLDTSLPRIVGECLLKYYSGEAKNVSEVAHLLLKENPLKFDVKAQPRFYEYKLKQFLLAFALGMTATTIWDGLFNANGGYIVVKEDGDVVCYHFFDRNELEEYLFTNTYFDTPSTSRHEFGDIYQEGGTTFLKLNLLVRFIG